MIVAVAADHGGYELKGVILKKIRALGHEALDLGTGSTDPVDYPDYALAAGMAISEKRADRAVVVCGSGVGACVAANKIPGIRAGLCHDTFSARQGVEDDDINVLCLGARVIGPELAKEIVKIFLGAVFSKKERHIRRLRKVTSIEKSFGNLLMENDGE